MRVFKLVALSVLLSSTLSRHTNSQVFAYVDFGQKTCSTITNYIAGGSSHIEYSSENTREFLKIYVRNYNFSFNAAQIIATQTGRNLNAHSAEEAVDLVLAYCQVHPDEPLHGAAKQVLLKEYPVQ